MTGFPALTALILVPALGAVAIALLPRSQESLAKLVGLGVSLGVATIAVLVALDFGTGTPDFQFVSHHPWISEFGISWKL